MYMPFLMCGYAVALLLMLLGCLVAMRTVSGLRGVGLLAWAMACGFVGVLLTAARLVAPAWVSILLANELIFAGCLLIYCCVADILAVRPSFLRPGILLALAAGLADAWFTWIHPGLSQRILIGTTLSGLLAALTARLLFRGGPLLEDPLAVDEPSRTLPRALGVLQILLVLLCSVRCVLTVLHAPAEYIRLDIVQALFTYINMLFYLGSAAGLVWLALCAHRRDLYALAHTDGLTGLLNRRAFEDLLSREIRRASDPARPAPGEHAPAVLLLDIDRFKEVNDFYGHATGDEVLRQVAHALRNGVRPGDPLARYGGEEFVILMRDCSLVQAQDAAERLRLCISAMAPAALLPAAVGTLSGIRVTASLGVAALLPEEAPSQLLLRCDQALYRSKRGGRNRVTADLPGAPAPVLVPPPVQPMFESNPASLPHGSAPVSDDDANNEIPRALHDRTLRQVR